MKLCPYPFSRMQTKNDQAHTENKGGFFPCCPSWFNQSYWDLGLEKNLDDIWNGKAAVELRQKMYEGDYSFCNRNECKIPLMSIDELSNPDINFIETPISKENLEAIKQKNPIMPKQPSSLHLVADLRCNLKCPTCRPEVISNTNESVEADEEFDLVHKLSADLEIVKMASSGEVFYSQVQRKLLKSFNKEDFPKLRRVHIVSNGTLFNQKTYNDLLPGTSYIKDISISLDAGSKEVYEKLRGPYWEQVKSNLAWLGQMRKSGKFELLTINCTLIKDNYRDIPNLVALGKKCNVDRILIQKYNFALNQGYKTHEEQIAQAIHLPTHPEHVHMIRTLEMFKNEPLVHTLLDIEGFDHKIESKVRTRKAFAEIQSIKLSLANEDYSEALKSINDLFSAGKAQLEKMQKNLMLDSVQMEKMPNAIFPNLGREDLAELKQNLIVVLSSCVYDFQRSGDYTKAVNSFILLSYFTEDYAPEVLPAVANCLEELFRFKESKIVLLEGVKKNLNGSMEKDQALQKSKLYSLYMQISFLQKKQKDYSDALIYFNSAKNIEPAEVAGTASEQMYYIYAELAYSFKAQSNTFLAIKYFQEAYNVATAEKKNEINEQLYYIYCDLGFSFKEQLNSDESIEYFKKAQAIEPENAKGVVGEQLYYVYRDRGFLMQKNGKYLQASIDLTEALVYGPGDEYVFFSLGISLKRQKRYSEAKASFNKGLAINSNHYYSLMELGIIALLEDRRDEALQLFLIAQKIEPKEKISYNKKMIKLSRRKKLS